MARDPRVRRLYEQRGWRTAWSEPQAARFLLALDASERHGLGIGAFQRLVSDSTSSWERDATLSLAAIAYADALAHGAADPQRIEPIFTLARNKVDVVAGLGGVIDSGDVAGWLAGLAPADAEYRALSDAYLRHRAEIDAATAAAIPEGALLRPGGADPRVPAIGEALLRKKFLTEPPPSGEVYGPELSEAVKRLQAGEGLAVDGVVGPATLWALNAGPAERARQLALNLERWRWLDRAPPPTRIDVNTAATTLVYLRDGRPVVGRRTVVGRPDWATPSLGETFGQLVVNPPWRVPASIASREIFPKGPAYLQRHNMYVSGGTVIQRPGPDAALGQVKFDMQNRYAIYLHDTPAKALFAQPERHRSHGCVRVEDAVGFARLLVEERGKGEEFERALASGKTYVLKLGEDILVRLLYRTAFMAEGEAVFVRDAYGRDEALAAALGMPVSKRGAATPYAEIPLGP